MASLELTLKRSTIGQTGKQKANLKGLGLSRLHQTVRREDTPAVRRMVKKILHLVEVKEVE